MKESSQAVFKKARTTLTVNEQEKESTINCRWLDDRMFRESRKAKHANASSCLETWRPIVHALLSIGFSLKFSTPHVGDLTYPKSATVCLCLDASIVWGKAIERYHDPGGSLRTLKVWSPRSAYSLAVHCCPPRVHVDVPVMKPRYLLSAIKKPIQDVAC